MCRRSMKNIVEELWRDLRCSQGRVSGWIIFGFRRHKGAFTEVSSSGRTLRAASAQCEEKDGEKYGQTNQNPWRGRNQAFFSFFPV